MAADLSPIASDEPTEGGASSQSPAPPPASVSSSDDASTKRSYRSLSLVIPTYNEAESLRELHRQLCEHIGAIGVPFEILLIDDGSSDDTPSIVRELNAADERVRYVRLRRNFGKAAALSEGFRRATGDVVVTMDADLQDNPGEVIKLLDALDQGFDLCSGWKWPRLDPIGKRWPSKVFNFAVRKGTGVQLHDVNCGLKAYRRELLQSVSVYGDMHRFIPVLADAAGFKVTEVKVSHRPRQFGHSKYSVGRFSRGLLDFLTVMFLTRYRNRPLHVIGGLAMTMGLLGGGVLLYLTIGWIGGTPIAGRPLFFLGILLLIVSIQLLTFGLLAEMVTSFFLEKRNDYPILEEIGFDEERT